MRVRGSGFDLREEDERCENNLRSVSNGSEIRNMFAFAEARDVFIYISELHSPLKCLRQVFSRH